eukprot:12166-Heterococcus_DN1.PRE.3
MKLQRTCGIALCISVCVQRFANINTAILKQEPNVYMSASAAHGGKHNVPQPLTHSAHYTSAPLSLEEVVDGSNPQVLYLLYHTMQAFCELAVHVEC